MAHRRRPRIRRRAVAAILLLAFAGGVLVADLTRNGGGRSFGSATAYTRTPPPFAARRTVRVSSAAELRDAIEHLRAGDEVTATRSFDVSGEFAIAKRLAAPGAVLDLGTGGGAVRFALGTEQALPAVWIHDSANLRIGGGDVTNPRGGDGIEVTGNTDHVTWWGFTVHDVGGSGLSALPAHGAIRHLDVAGSVTRWGLRPDRDPHRERGTGFHAAILADVDGAVFDDNRVAIDARDGPGDGIEIGNPTAAGEIRRNTLILAAHDLRFRATSAVAGNGLQLWGRVPVEADVPYLVTRDTEGRAVDANGVSPGVSMSGVRILYGRAFGCCRNPHLRATESALPAVQPWDPRFGVRYLDVRPERHR